MKKTFLTSLFLVTALTAISVNAATLYKWIDQDGNVVYQDTPPPSDVKFEESEVESPPLPLSDSVGQQIEEAARTNPVSLYTVPVCDSCDLVRLYLEKNSIPFVEKDVRSNIDTQAELQELSGTLSVPTLAIGSKTINGFSSSAIKSALVDAGFPMDRPAGVELPATKATVEEAVESEVEAEAETETEPELDPELEFDQDEPDFEDTDESAEIESSASSTDS